MKLRAEHINQSYQGISIIQDINIEVAEGEIVSLLGPSGVGKTTLFNVLSGIDKPDSGVVLKDEENITGQAGKVSYMLQKDLLFEHKSVVDNVALPLIIKGLKRTEAHNKAMELFEEFGLSHTENKYPAQLSGGMRQRAALLRTYLFSKDIALLDEPFSSLDAITKRNMHSWYLKIVEIHNIATLLITHDIEEALRLSDRIYLMTGTPGRIADEIVIKRSKKAEKDFETSIKFLEYKAHIIEKLTFE